MTPVDPMDVDFGIRGALRITRADCTLSFGDVEGDVNRRLRRARLEMFAGAAAVAAVLVAVLGFALQSSHGAVDRVTTKSSPRSVPGGHRVPTPRPIAKSTSTTATTIAATGPGEAVPPPPVVTDRNSVSTHTRTPATSPAAHPSDSTPDSTPQPTTTTTTTPPRPNPPDLLDPGETFQWITVTLDDSGLHGPTTVVAQPGMLPIILFVDQRSNPGAYSWLVLDTGGTIERWHGDDVSGWFLPYLDQTMNWQAADEHGQLIPGATWSLTVTSS